MPGTRFETLCPVDVLLFFRVDAPQIEWLSTYGGSVTAANCPEGGVAFTLRIPRRAALEAAA